MLVSNQMNKTRNIMKNIKLIFSVLILLFVVSACNEEEFFELKNPPQAPWQSLSDMEKAPIGAYYGLSGNGGFRTIFGCGRLIGELFADAVNLAPETEGYPRDGDSEDMYNRSISGTSIALFDNSMFNSGYFAIGFANGALDFINAADDDPFPNEPGSMEEIKRIKGELYFVRAYAYYWVARAYLPAYPNDEKRIPWRINQATNFEEAVASELASSNDVYQLIIDDLALAKELLPERFDPSKHNASYEDGRANKFAAAALRAKVLFHMGMHDEALTELNFVIDQNGGDYDLSEDPIEAWNKTGIARGKEVIWYYTLWAGDGLGGSSNWKHPRRMEWYSALTQASSDPANNGARFIRASDSFLQAVGWMNPDKSETAEAANDKRYQQVFIRFEAPADLANRQPGEEPRGQFEPTSPYVWGHKYYRSNVIRSTNLPMLRLADMYLLRATINASSNTSAARADLNMVRNRAGIGDFTGSDAELMNAIEIERMKEMAFEGDRLFYLQGLKKDIPNGDRGAGSVPWNGNFYSEVPDYEVEINQGYSAVVAPN
jgi:hypothetical protein